MDLKLKICKGSPARKILYREAIACGATSLILGTSEVHHKIRSRISVAKYCARNLPRTISLVCVDNGKVLFHREPNASDITSFQSHDVSESKFKRRKILPKSLLSLPPPRSLSSSGIQNNSMALVPLKTQEIPECKSTWAVLRRMLLHGQRIIETSSTKKLSVVQRILRLPSRQSVATIHPDQKQITSPDREECYLESDLEKGAIVLYSPDTNSVHSSKIFLEELKALGEKYSRTCQLFGYQELLLATNNFKSGLFSMDPHFISSYFLSEVSFICLNYVFRKLDWNGGQQPSL